MAGRSRGKPTSAAISSITDEQVSIVIPAYAGIQGSNAPLSALDPRFRGGDGKRISAMNLRERIGVDIGRKLPLEQAVEWAVANQVGFIDLQLDTGANAL